MDGTRQQSQCMKILKRIREKGRSLSNLKDLIDTLQDEALTDGLEDVEIKKLIDILINIKFNSTTSVSLIKCLIPRNKLKDADIKTFVSWFLSVSSAAANTMNSLLQWMIGCWEYHLIDRNSLYIFYDPFFYLLIKEERIESRLAQLVYLMTKPEDVTRRQVLRLLQLNERYRKPQKHIIALLSLFKSYKPEYVPEKIPAINIQSIWRPILEVLRVGFQGARERIAEQADNDSLNCDWNVFRSTNTKKNEEPLVPSVRYFNIGSSIFNNRVEKSIFDVSNMVTLGQFHPIVKMPCNATSLLTNVIGYHLLTFADNKYQQRFMHNLYYSLWRSFIFENGRHSDTEMSRILEMTYEFCKYMQHGITILSYFINEYLSCCIDDHHIELLSLMQWSTVPTTELQDHVLKHIRLMFYSSSLENKCKIIRTLRIMMMNLCVVNDSSFKNKPFPFLGRKSFGTFFESVLVIEDLCRELVKSALDIHSYDSVVVSEAMSFYEQIDLLGVYKKTSFVNLAPPGVIYSSFSTRSCASLSRICALLFQYGKYFGNKKSEDARKSIKWLIIYAEDFVNALWYDNCFSNRFGPNRYFLRRLSEEVVKDHSSCKLDSSLNISNHYAVLPYIYMLSTRGMKIDKKEYAAEIAADYYYSIYRFLKALLGDQEL